MMLRIRTNHQWGILPLLLLISFVCHTSRCEARDGASATMSSQVAATRDGVSAALAAERAMSVDSLIYRLHFTFEERSGDTDASAEISFLYRGDMGASTLPLDLTCAANHLSRVTINGKKSTPDFRDDHIYIPTRALRMGRNVIRVEYTTRSEALNRRGDYLYTLFVPFKAHSAFPCFDQPDMKASFCLTLDIPAEWSAVGNGSVARERVERGVRHVEFMPTEPLSTYLFAFAAGHFNTDTFDIRGHKIGILHRENALEKCAQLPRIADEVVTSLEWLERYTGIPYPFMKYDLVILPGFQFGGMEHTGATFYNDTRLFLAPYASPDDRLSRSELIAHETAHMWFGDLVTMRWFDDVWTKEVFANYFGAAITRDMYPDVDHDLLWLRRYQDASMSHDRTPGATSIRQPLDDMKDASLIYNNIIYNKAPVMLSKLRDMVGEESLQTALREYLTTYAYGNATWPQLIEILARHTDKPVREFSRTWVDARGCPVYDISLSEDRLICRQTDLHGSEEVWPQEFEVTVMVDEDVYRIPVKFTGDTHIYQATLPATLKDTTSAVIIPNTDGKGYGIFKPGQNSISRLLEDPALLDKVLGADGGEAGKMAILLNLHELALLGDITPEQWCRHLDTRIVAERRKERPDPLMSASMVKWIAQTLYDLPNPEEMEVKLMQLYRRIDDISLRNIIATSLAANCRSRRAVDFIYDLWSRGEESGLSETQLTNIAYELCVRRPSMAHAILLKQRARIGNADRMADFEFIAPAVDPDPAIRKRVFEMLSDVKSRRNEPRALRTLSLLCHPHYGEESAALIYPALALLPEIKATGDIFFPAQWCSTLLSSQRSEGAGAELRRYLRDATDINPLLRNKILNALKNYKILTQPER